MVSVWKQTGLHQAKAETNGYSHHWIFQTEASQAELLLLAARDTWPPLNGHWARKGGNSTAAQ